MKSYKNNTPAAIDKLNGAHLQGQHLQGQVFQKKSTLDKENLFENEELHSEPDPQKAQIRELKARVAKLKKELRNAKDEGLKTALKLQLEDAENQLKHAQKHPVQSGDTLPYGSENKGAKSSYNPKAQSAITHQQSNLGETKHPEKLEFVGDGAKEPNQGGTGNFEKIHEIPEAYHGKKIKIKLEANANYVRDSFDLVALNAAGQAMPVVAFPLLQNQQMSAWITLPLDAVALKMSIKSENPSNTLWFYKVHLKLPKLRNPVLPKGIRHLREEKTPDDN